MYNNCIYKDRGCVNNLESEWERTLPYVELEKNQIIALFKGVLEENDIVCISRANEGCRTTNYFIESKYNRYVLKIFYNKDVDYRKELELSKVLKGKIPIPTVYKYGEDKKIGNKKYIIYGYLDGISLSRYVSEGNKIEVKFVKQVAKAMSQIHKIKYKQIGFLNDKLKIENELPPLYEWYTIFMGERVKKRLGKDKENSILKIIEDNKDILYELDKQARLVHGDFQGGNILINENGDLSGILDWEFAMAGHPLADIGQFFRYSEYFNDELIKIFECEYRKYSDYNIENDWYKLSMIRDIVNLIQLISKEAEMPKKYKSVINRIKTTINLVGGGII